jgi:hypothetical protein
VLGRDPRPPLIGIQKHPKKHLNPPLRRKNSDPQARGLIWLVPEQKKQKTKATGSSLVARRSSGLTSIANRR